MLGFFTMEPKHASKCPQPMEQTMKPKTTIHKIVNVQHLNVAYSITVRSSMNDRQASDLALRFVDADYAKACAITDSILSQHKHKTCLACDSSDSLNIAYMDRLKLELLQAFPDILNVNVALIYPKPIDSVAY